MSTAKVAAVDSTPAGDSGKPHSGLGFRVIFLGGPGSGKGTQARNIVERCTKNGIRICHLSTGDLLREEVKAGSEIGEMVGTVMENGGLVDDEVVLKLIEKHIIHPDPCLKTSPTSSTHKPLDGWILDGFPRTVGQAAALEGVLTKFNFPLHLVVMFNIDDNTLVKRVCGRLVHQSSGRSYHLSFNPPKQTNPPVDDVTGEPLAQRDDDNEVAFRKRLVAYYEKTLPLINFYKERGLITEVDASPLPEKLTDDVMRKIEEALASR